MESRKIQAIFSSSMVLMETGKSKSHAVAEAAAKREVEDPLEEEHGPLHKRPKVFLSHPSHLISFSPFCGIYIVRYLQRPVFV